MSSHGSKQAKQITLTWGHPKATYMGGDGGPQVAKVYFTPASFQEFRDVLVQKCSGERHTSSGAVQYQDEDGDWVPIESQTEYDEARRFLYRSRLPVPLRVTFIVEEGRCRGSGKTHCSGSGKLHMKEVQRSLRKFKKEMSGSALESVKLPSREHKCSWVGLPCSGKECARSAEKLKLKGTTAPPAWFEKYMQKFKAELLTEVATMMDQKIAGASTSNPVTLTRPPKVVTLPLVGKVVTVPTQQAPQGAEASAAEPPISVESTVSTASSSGSATKPKMLELDEVVEPLLYVDLKSQKVLKKMAKAHNSERKLKKLNSKLEQLELKRARLLEWNRRRQEQNQGSPQPLPGCPAPEPRIDAVVLSGGTVSDKSHVTHNSIFTKTWRVLNTGNVPWNEKTELRLAWLTQGLKPLESTMRCPPLQPGQDGDVSIKFQAPDFTGLFESYWHFYQDDVRFGQWMGCAVIVDPKSSVPADEGSTASNLNASKGKDDSAATTDKMVTVNLATTEDVEGAAGPCEDRAEYESDPDDNNNSHSDNENASDSDTEDSDDDSESFVHVPMPQCYQYQAVPLFNIQPGEEEEVSLLQGEEKEENSAGPVLPGATPPTTPREPDSEEELFEEASSADAHLLASTASASSEAAAAAATAASAASAAATAATAASAAAAAATSISEAIESGQKSSPPVHILPDNLLTGAINVASRALSATEAIMKSFQGGAYNIPPQPQAEAAATTPPQPITSQPSSPVTLGPQAIPLPPPPSMATPPDSPDMQLLREMGFDNMRLNAMLLSQHNNNLDQVVCELLSLDGRNH